ncbi:hypothetical protein B0H14DRAFT_3051755 [Mycena olivaceomarginata]|nr:hypothetical protein B0H14DRAFT_3051755 [Mycena olivaceomarginata]
MLGHVVKRGMAHLQDVSPEYVAKLEEDSQLYRNSDYGMVFIDPERAVVFVILASIQYTHGQVVASLAMIESPSSNLIVKRNEPAYTDEKPLIPAPELDADVELTLINHKPITASLCGTLVHLRRVGGWFARWRGLHISILYMILHAAFTHIFGASRLISIAGCVLLSPVHMLWTHSIIALPRTARLIHLKQCTPLVLPTLIVALAQQATCFLPSLVGSLLDLRMSPEQVWIAAQGEPLALALLGLRILAVPLTFAVIALFAALLPADVHTIVPFDGSFAMAGLSSKALFVAAWRSFDRAAPLRVLKVYAKMLFVQFAVLLIGTAVMTAEVYIIGGDTKSRLTLAYTSARALLELNALEHNGLSW